MRRGEILTALGFIAFSLAVIVQSLEVGIGWVQGQPQSGFFPFWLGLLLGACGLIAMVQFGVRARPSLARFFHDRTALASVAKVSATGALMLILIYLVGFYTASIAYMFLYTRFVGKHRWPAVIALSLLIPVGGYLLFERTLEILLPRGMYSLIPFFD